MVHRPTECKSTRGGLAPWQIERALRLLLSAELSIGQVAELCGLSRCYFERAFKVSIGMPPYRWAVRQRVQRAVEMLERTDDRLSFISSSCGFSDQSHMTRVFRAAKGSTPAAWRRQCRAGLAPSMVAAAVLPSLIELRPGPGA